MWKIANIIFLVLTFGALVPWCHGVDTAPVQTNSANYGYMAFMTNCAEKKYYLGVVVSRLYMVTTAEITSSASAGFITFFDGASSSVAKILTDGQVTVVKACTMTYPQITNVYKLTPSLFFDSAAATVKTAASFVYLKVTADSDLLFMGTTEVLPDSQCPAEIAAKGAPSGVTYDPAKHYCLLTDATFDCSWILPTTVDIDTLTFRPLLMINNQVVGFYRGGSCGVSTHRWETAIIYDKILPSRNYIISSSENMAMVL